jgi:ABC-2 type transport system permease protein
MTDIVAADEAADGAGMDAVGTEAERTAHEARARRLAEESFAPAGPTAGFLRGTAESIRSIWSYRELLLSLTRRELKAKYKDSTLGFVWSLIRPLAQLVIYYVALGKFLGAERSIGDYAIFVFAGLTSWQLFSEIVMTGTGAIVANGGLVKKIYLPREVFPLSVVGAALFNFLIQVVILVVACFIAGKPPTGTDLLYFPLAMLVLVVYGTALAFLFSALNVYLRDIQHLVEILIMVLFWTTPTVYSWHQAHEQLGSGVLGAIYDGNPLAQSALAFQKAFWGAAPADAFPADLAVNLGWSLLVGVLLLWFCQRVFARLQSNFAQEL